MTKTKSEPLEGARVDLGRSIPLAEKVAEHLRAAVAEGRYKPGERLPTEQALGALYGVSRPIVREAIGRLKQEGLVLSRQGAGAFVADRLPSPTFRFERIDLADKARIADIIEVLIAFEASASEHAARRRTPEQLARIKDSLDAMQRAIEAGEPGVEEDLAFHRAIAEAGDNPLFAELTAFFDASVRHFIRTARANSAREHGFTEVVQGEHRKIFAAIEAADPAAARHEAEAHLLNAAGRLEIYLR